MGVTGNPGGVPKNGIDIAAIAHQHGSEAIDALLQIMRTGQDKLRVAAAIAILDRAYGRPQPTVRLTLRLCICLPRAVSQEA